MNITFIQDDYFEYTGVMSIIAVLEGAGHGCSVIIERDQWKVIRALQRFGCDIVAFSCMSGVSYDFALKMAEEIKKGLNVLTVFGGPHPTYFPEIIENPCIDIVCIGEGEYAMLELADKLSTGQDISGIKNLWIKKDGLTIKNELRPLIEDLDELPFVERRQYYSETFFKNLSFRVFTVGRGCPFKCSFCYNETLRKMYKFCGRYVRLRDESSIIEEIKGVKARYGLRHIVFTDDVFGVHKKWIRSFLKLYKRDVEVSFACMLTANIIEDEEIVSLLKEAGCTCVCFGIESGNERTRKDLLKKEITDDQIINSARLLKKYRIKFLTFNMIGMPGETVDQACRTIELNSRIGTDYPRYSILTLYPRTGIAKYSIEKGYATKEDVESLKSTYFKSSIIHHGNIKELINLHKLAYLMTKAPYFKKLVLKMIKLPPNKIFDLIFLITYARIMKRVHNMNIRDIFRMGLHSLNQYK